MRRFARLTDKFLRKMEKHAAAAAALPIAFLLFVAAFFSLPLAGQEAGPIPGPPLQYEPAHPENPPPLKSPTVKPSEDAPPPPKTPAANRQSSGITNDPPSIPVDQIIQQFTEREVEFKNEREIGRAHV